MIDKQAIHHFSPQKQINPHQQIGKEAQSKGNDAGHELKAGMPRTINSTAGRISDVEEITLSDVEALCKNQAEESLSESSEHSDSRALSKSTLHHVQQPVSYFSTIIKFGKNIEPKQIVVIILLVICILFDPSRSSVYDVGEYSIYQTVYSKNMFQNISKDNVFDQKQEDFLKNLQYPVDQDRVIIYLPKSTQKMMGKDKKQLSYTKCIESTHHGCVDYRLRHFGSMNIQLQNWVLDHIAGHQRLAFESNTNFIVIILLAAMKVRQLSISSEIKKILVIESYMDQIHSNAIKLSLIENQCQDVVQFLSKRYSFHGIIKNYEYVFVSQVFYMFNVYPFQQGAGLTSPLTFVTYVPQKADSFLAILSQEMGEKELYVIRFQIDEGKYYVQQQINIVQESQINSKEIMVILIRHAPSMPSTGQSVSTRF